MNTENSKRRLSQGSALQNLSDSDDEPEEFAAVAGGRRSMGLGQNGKRRSSFGIPSSRAHPPQDQARLAEMYKTIIKMSSENVSKRDFLLAEISLLNGLPLTENKRKKFMESKFN